MNRLEKHGFGVGNAEEYKDLRMFSGYTIVITGPDNVNSLIKKLELETFANVIGIIVFFKDDFMRNYQHLQKNTLVIDLYDNFDKVFHFLVMNARFYHRIEENVQIIYSLGMDHGNYYMYNCMCYEHMNKLRKISTIPLQKLIEGNMSDISTPATINSVLSEYDKLMTSPVDPKKIVEFLCKDERFMFHLINSILKTNNLNFYRFITEFIVNYQKFFEIDNMEEEPHAPSVELFTMLHVKPELLQDFTKYWVKDKYFFFFGVCNSDLILADVGHYGQEEYHEG